MDKQEYLGKADLNAIESLYEQYLENPKELEESWRKFFEGFEFARKNFQTKPTEIIFDTGALLTTSPKSPSISKVSALLEVSSKITTPLSSVWKG